MPTTLDHQEQESLAAIPVEAMAPKLMTALKAALPYVERAASISSNRDRQRKAQDDLSDIRAIIAVAEGCA